MAEAGVLEGMKFTVLEPKRIIKDPLTQEVLGELQRGKVRVKAVQVFPKFSIARTYETYRVGNENPFAILRKGISAWSILEEAGGSEIRVKTLNARDKPAGYHDIAEHESYIKVGDPVEFLELPDPPSKAKELGVAAASISMQDILLSGPYRFVFAPETGRAKTIVFGKDGSIVDGNNQNEHRWRINKETVEILNTEGVVFSRFKHNPILKRFESTDDADTKALKGQYFEIEKNAK